MPEPQELLLVRHGQSTANARGIWQGQMEFPLSEEGRRQAVLAGRALAREPLDGLYSSPLSRALETAEIIRIETAFTREPVPLAGLSERSGGLLEGRTWAEQEERNPELAKKFLDIPEEERWALVGAETDEQVMERFGRALSSIRASHPEGSRIVIVTHGGVMRAFLRDLFGPETLPGTQRASNASITRIGWSGEEPPRLLDLASTEHLFEDGGLRASMVE
ncbi:MAG: histidine phosphatase family protein [Actinomycetota bacterium]|nr:histidine phosphatase family protein [Actinomycetota bacterium]